MRYVPPSYLRDRFHLLPDSADARPLAWRELPLVWDPRPTPADPHGASWAVRRDDPRYRAALDRLTSLP